MTRVNRCLLRLLRLLFAALILSGSATGFAQVAKPLTPAPAAAAPATSAEVLLEPQAIPVADIAVKAEAALTEVRQLQKKTEIDELLEASADRLAVLDKDASFRMREMRQLKLRTTSLDNIRHQEEEWRSIALRASAITRDLTRGALQLDRDLQQLDALAALWDVTAQAATAAAAPPEVLERAQDLRANIKAAKKSVLEDRAKVLALQGRSTDIGVSAAEARQQLVAATERAVTRLLYRDSPALWVAKFWSTSIHEVSSEASASLMAQISAMLNYAREHAKNMVFHGALLLALITLLSGARSSIESLSENDENLRHRKEIFDMPIVSAMLIAMFFSTWFYPNPPKALWIMIGILVAVPLMIFARRVVDSRFYPFLYAGVGFYLADRVRALFSPLPGVSRIMLLIEALAVMLFILVSLRRSGRALDQAPSEQGFALHVLRFGSRAVLYFTIIALASNIGGYAKLADLVMRTTLSSVYAAVVLYVLTRVGEGVIQGLLYVPPISMLTTVQRHRVLFSRHINGWLKWIAFLYWIWLSLQALGLLPAAIELARSFWAASTNLGSITLSVRDIILFIFIVWAAFTISRLVRFILEEEVFSRVRLDRGLPYAISMMVHYIILLSGMVIALAAIGVDMTKFTIVAGALTVGIGFGLQNIVNNFVSGLIVLFERPIKVGDTIQMDDMVGRVQHIGIRATIVHSTAGAEVIVPNGKLISDRVTNWTLSSMLRQIAVPVITKPGIDVAELKALLLDTAHLHKKVLATPSPEILFNKRGIDSLEFELRVWIDDLDAWLQVRSDLTTDINEVLRKNEIAAQAPPP